MWLGRGILEAEPHSAGAQLTMGDGDSLMRLSVVSFKGSRSWLDNLLLWALILPITFPNAAVDRRSVEINELPPPNLNSSMNVVRIGQNVSLSCFTKNTSADITYSLFWGTKYLESKKGRGGAVDFYLRISSANKTGPYKCKTTVSNLWKYSQDFNFTIAEDESCSSCQLSLLLPGVLLGLLVIFLVLAFWIYLKYKKGKTLRENASKGSGDVPTQGELYANVYKTQTGAEQPQEIHYAIPVFQEAAPAKQEGDVNREADCIYSELTY
ncbi:allergin-1 isoform X1 [Apodemus sylvaticus]|uniref:allergin-1 isoform X1 n=1 Tax=Apodemus sylvaticus TaxID=10129 RepID=UPI0022425F73|nr:allergin-1 isoform X1 [Apodemus sylvaticus]XP_052051738.1 allergin-1 isoform X1 [Apodemus sylvaticus]